MKYLHRLVVLVASAAFFIASAQAQTGTVTSNAFAIGKGPGVTGLGSVPCSSGQVPIGQAGAPQCKTPSGDVTIDTGGVTSIGANTVTTAKIADGNVTNAKIAPGSANTFKGSLNGTTTSDITIASCSAIYQFTQWVSGSGWQCGLTPVLPSRAVAATLNLSAFSAVTTLGYAAPGDSGGATFQKVPAGTTLTDTFVNCNPCTLAGGSGYTNGTYNGVAVAGGGGQSCVAQVVVSGGAVTAVNFAVPCVTHKVGDPLTTANTNIGGTGSGFLYTVTSISTPKASFTDSAGNLWQYVPNGFVNILQFGAVGDWNGNDAAATNNTNSIWSATAYASVQIGSAAAQVYGNQIWFPRGAYMTCGGQFLNSAYNFPVPTGVVFTGGGYGVSTMRQCATDPSGTHYIELCDSNMQVGEFGCKVEKMTFDSSAITSSTAGVAVLYSSAGQQFALAQDVQINAGKKSCLKYEIGRGGAANDIWIGINCVQFDSATNPAFSFNASSVQHVLLNSVCASVPNGGAANCVNHQNGRLYVNVLDIEGFVLGVVQNVATVGNNSVIENVQQNGTGGCSAVVQLANTNVAGNITFQNIAHSCPMTIQNGQSGGANFVPNIRGPTMCVSGACAAAVP